MILIGLMSGTSADGTDAVCVRIEGAPPGLHWQLLSHVSLPHPCLLYTSLPPTFRYQFPNSCSFGQFTALARYGGREKPPAVC